MTRTPGNMWSWVHHNLWMMCWDQKPGMMVTESSANAFSFVHTLTQVKDWPERENCLTLRSCRLAVCLQPLEQSLGFKKTWQIGMFGTYQTGAACLRSDLLPEASVVGKTGSELPPEASVAGKTGMEVVGSHTSLPGSVWCLGSRQMTKSSRGKFAHALLLRSWFALGWCFLSWLTRLRVPLPL